MIAYPWRSWSARAMRMWNVAAGKGRSASISARSGIMGPI
jgi:hypothetical protein